LGIGSGRKRAEKAEVGARLGIEKRDKRARQLKTSQTCARAREILSGLTMKVVGRAQMTQPLLHKQRPRLFLGVESGKSLSRSPDTRASPAGAAAPSTHIRTASPPAAGAARGVARKRGRNERAKDGPQPSATATRHARLGLRLEPRCGCVRARLGTPRLCVAIS
jgi:hypothetical protein